MKFSFVLFSLYLSSSVFAAPAGDSSGVSTYGTHEGTNEPRGVIKKGASGVKGKIGGVLEAIHSVKDFDDDDWDSDSDCDDDDYSKKERLMEKKKEIFEKSLAKVFKALKDSGLVNGIIRMSLVDPKVRPAVTKITIDLLKSGKIPYEHIFVALKESGLAADVVEYMLTDPDVREGMYDLVKETVPALSKCHLGSEAYTFTSKTVEEQEHPTEEDEHTTVKEETTEE